MVGRALIFTMAKQLKLGWNNRTTIDRLISNYFAMPKPLDYGRDDDYIVLTMPATAQLAQDSRHMPGLQARLYQATLNSYRKGDFANFPADSSVKVNASSIASLDQLQSLQPVLDANGDKILKLAAGQTWGGRSEFIAELREKNAVLYFNRSMNPDTIKEILRPFIAEYSKRKIFAIYIGIKAAKIK